MYCYGVSIPQSTTRYVAQRQDESTKEQFKHGLATVDRVSRGPGLPHQSSVSTTSLLYCSSYSTQYLGLLHCFGLFVAFLRTSLDIVAFDLDCASGLPLRYVYDVFPMFFDILE